ncbi:hypothetical protein EUA98_19425 [Pengzhenrongella frigida]|uniref:DUF6531 domain-containing protein n=1 Tax=Pengzhenrongella frigida TaxID=1259133 RepID=A0A4V1ZGQ1_9MICO|nr:hypothetical protein EUA98_19425 [Cellulomonas sp. HLT2-17]
MQDWVNRPQANRGMIIAEPAYSTTGDAWSSSRGARMPVLRVTYADPLLPAVALPEAQVTGEPSACLSDSASMLRDDPVNTATGHLVESATDVEVGSSPMPLRLRRSYDSGRTANSVFGSGWTFEFGAAITRDDATGRAVVDTGAGNLVGFTQKPEGSPGVDRCPT